MMSHSIIKPKNPTLSAKGGILFGLFSFLVVVEEIVVRILLHV